MGTPFGRDSGGDDAGRAMIETCHGHPLSSRSIKTPNDDVAMVGLLLERLSGRQIIWNLPWKQFVPRSLCRSFDQRMDPTWWNGDAGEKSISGLIAVAQHRRRDDQTGRHGAGFTYFTV